MMQLFRRLSLVLVIVAFTLLNLPRTAHAYLDPGSGSYLLQILLAFFLGALFVAKRYWHKLKDFLVKLFKHGNKNKSQP